MEFVIITGMSGAGKSQAMKSLEDLGYFCIDNMPPMLIGKFIELISNGSSIKKVALVIDIRGGEFFEDLNLYIELINNAGFKSEIIFLEAKDEVLVKRYKENRRTHPLDPEGRIIDGIRKEREKLKEIREISDRIFDTSDLSLNNFKKEIKSMFIDEVKSGSLTVSVMSFGFKKGIPIDADMVFDVRFLPNPYYVPSLKELTGNTSEIQEYVMGFEDSRIFFDKVKDMVEFLIPKFENEGKSQVVIAFGCTGGKHRSVTMANKLYDYLVDLKFRTIVKHRDI
ncbi:MAG: RNase adapter RapZ [Firmicutes bacterium]|jgi:UPF0042 nucleotide-binding protein|nr:RNase adapter RapZ [Bacillota bacterium]